MQIQEILTYIIVVSASGLVIYNLYKTIRPGEKGNSGCSSNCKCDAVKMRKDLLKNTKKQTDKPIPN
jgi:hypothetical protein